MSSDLREISKEEVAKVNISSAFNQFVLTRVSQHHRAGDLVPLLRWAEKHQLNLNVVDYHRLPRL